jgi:hypothetical protein
MEGSQADVAALGATDPRYIVDLTNSAQYKSLTAFAAHTAAPLDRLEAILQLPLQYSNGPPGSGWHSWGSASIGETDAAAMPRCPVLFLHARTSQAGHERLVVVTIDRLFYQRVVWLLDAQAYEVGQGGPRHIFSRGRASGIGLRSFYQKTGGDMGGINDIRFFAGQPDPNDASQFTIPYKMNSESGTIVGQLKDDDGIELKPDGPIAQHKIFWPRTD